METPAEAPATRSRAVLAPATLLVPRVRAMTPEPRDDDAEAVWIERARGGDTRAFEALYHRYLPLVHGVLLSHAPRRELDDLVQDVFLKAWLRLDGLRETASFGGWLAALARNRAFDLHRAHKDASELTDDLPARESDAAGAFEALDAIRGLPEAYRETLVLRLVEGLTGPEIAAMTGLTPGSVRVNLHRGLKLLKERLTKGTDLA